jgi:hypothetical protein
MKIFQYIFFRTMITRVINVIKTQITILYAPNP